MISKLWRKGFYFILHVQVTKLKQSRNLEVGTELETMKVCCLLACSSWLAHPYTGNPGPHSYEWHLQEWAEPSHTESLIKIYFTGLSLGQFYRGILSIMIPSSQIPVGLCQIDKNQPEQMVSSKGHSDWFFSLRNFRSSYCFRILKAFSI